MNVSNGNNYTIVDGSSSDDSITNQGYQSTIFGYSGNDTIQNNGARNVQIDAGKDNDYIFNSGDGTYINGGEGNDIVRNEGDNVVIHGGAGNDDISNNRLFGNTALIYGDDGDDYIAIDNPYNPIYNTIFGGTGEDTIYINTSRNFAYGDENNDSILSTGGYNTLDGGSGDDIIVTGGYNATKNVITGGAGKDTIKLVNSGHVINYTEGDGNDVIEGINANDTLNIVFGSITRAGVRGNDAFLYFGDEYIILKDASEHILKLKLADGEAFTTVLTEELEDDLEETYDIIGTNANETIKTTLSGATITAGKGDDLISLSGDSSGTLIKYYSGDGNDTIFGFNADDTIQIIGNTYTTVQNNNNLTVNVGEGSILLRNFKNTAANIIGTLEGSDPDIPNGWKFANGVATATLATAKGLDLADDYGEGIITVDGSKITGGFSIHGNILNNSIKGSKGADMISGGGGNDTISLGGGADVYVYQEGNDLIQDYATVDTIEFSSDFISLTGVETIGSNVVYTTNFGSITVKNGKGKNITLIDSDGSPINFDEVTIPAGWQFDSAKKILKATVASAENEIDLTEDYGEEIIKVDGSKITGGVEIYGNDLNNSIKGGKGADVIAGGSGNDTVSLGGGADVYIYTGGNDLISDYATVDAIQIDTLQVEISGVETVKSNVIYSTSEGNITVKNGKGKNITLIDSDGSPINFDEVTIPAGWQLDSDKNILQATVETAENEIDLSEGYDSVKNIDGSKVTSGVKIYGNDLNNSIKGGKGADVIAGGSGNDTVSLGGGADVYIYTGGNDLIQDYANADKIQIDTENISITDRKKSGKNIVYTTNVGKLTLKNAYLKNITLIDKNGETFQYSNSTKKITDEIWFLDEDKFLSNDINISDISNVKENNYSVGKIETQNYSNLENEEIILTFSENK